MCDVHAEVIGTAFFDVEMDALDYSVEDDGRLKLSDRPYLQVSHMFFVASQGNPANLALGFRVCKGYAGTGGWGVGLLIKQPRQLGVTPVQTLLRTLFTHSLRVCMFACTSV